MEARVFYDAMKEVFNDTTSDAEELVTYVQKNSSDPLLPMYAQLYYLHRFKEFKTSKILLHFGVSAYHILHEVWDPKKQLSEKSEVSQELLTLIRDYEAR